MEITIARNTNRIRIRITGKIRHDAVSQRRVHLQCFPEKDGDFVTPRRYIYIHTRRLRLIMCHCCFRFLVDSFYSYI